MTNARRDPTPSLRRRLLLTLFLPAAVVLTAGAVSDYFSAVPPYTEAFDQALLDSALVISAHVERDPNGRLTLALPQDALAVLRAGSRDSRYFRVSDAEGAFVAGDRDLPTPPTSAVNASGTAAMYRGQEIRLIGHSAYVGNDKITVAIAETTHERDALRTQILLTAVTTDVIVLGLILALIWFNVRTSLAPLWTVEQQVSKRSPRDLTPLSIGEVPTEIRSLVLALNRLFAVVRETASSQQQFLESAAHQLKTPLAGIQAQLELMANHEADAERRDRLQRILEAARRLSSTTRSLLTVARANDQTTFGQQAKRIDLVSVIESAIADHLSLAESGGIDLGAHAKTTFVNGTDWLLAEAVKALVANAIAHTPAGGSVTVSCGEENGTPYLEVSDTGIGIPVAERERVVERFFRASNARGAGSGLGLAIVNDVVLRHHAELLIGDGPNGVGTRVRIVFRGGGME